MHATLLNQVWIDRFGAPTPISTELVVGPIATNTFQATILGALGPAGLALFNQALTVLVQADCRNLNTNSYGLVEVSAGAASITLSSRNEVGAVVIDPTNNAQCTMFRQ